MCREGEGVLKRCCSLCHQMMHFFHQFLLYTTFEVLEPLWHTLQAHMRAASTVDQVGCTVPAEKMKECTRCTLQDCAQSMSHTLCTNVQDCVLRICGLCKSVSKGKRGHLLK
jgi:hypothetical protein